LFSREEWDVRTVVRKSDATELEQTIRECLAAKRAAHGIDSADFTPPERAMFQIGG
jgi:cyclic pyranopterin phosphate synthase